MKTITAHIQDTGQFHTRHVQDQLPEVVIPVTEIMALLSAVTVATVVIILSIWIAGMDVRGVSGAGGWGAAIIFFALAMDSRTPVALLQASTGMALTILAWLQFAVSPEYTIVAGVVIAAWLVVAVFQRLK